MSAKLETVEATTIFYYNRPYVLCRRLLPLYAESNLN